MLKEFKKKNTINNLIKKKVAKWIKTHGLTTFTYTWNIYTLKWINIYMCHDDEGWINFHFMLSCYHKFHLQMSPTLFNNLQRPSKDHIKTHKIPPLPHIKAWNEEANYSHTWNSSNFLSY
jgi:hypothetical protein